MIAKRVVKLNDRFNFNWVEYKRVPHDVWRHNCDVNCYYGIHSDKQKIGIARLWKLFLSTTYRSSYASSWRCCTTKFLGKVRLRNEQIEVITVHSRLLDPADIKKRNFCSALKDRATMAEKTPAKKIAAQKDVNRETAANTPAYNSNQMTISKKHQQNCPQMSHRRWKDLRLSIYYKWHIVVRISCIMIPGLKMKKIIVFATLPAIALLEQSDDWFAMGHSQQLQTSSIRSTQSTLRLTASICTACTLFLIKRRELSKTTLFSSGAIHSFSTKSFQF